MDLYLAFAWTAVGVLIGVIVTRIFYRITHGYARLILDTSNPEKDVYKLDVFDLEVLHKKKYLEVRICNDSLK